MADLFEAVTSWRTLVAVLVVFGVAPGLVLRAILLLYPKGHPRRKELIAELYVVPRWERPLFVAEQLEVGLTEGVPARVREIRVRRKRRRRMKKRRMRASVVAAIASVLALILQTTNLPVEAGGSSNERHDWFPYD
jgi:hypothetical protein